MITTATKNKLKKLGIDPDALVSAISDEKEIDITIPDGEFFSEQDLKTRDSAKYEEGKQAGEEMSVKAIKKAKNIDAPGKTVLALVEHLETKMQANESDTVVKLRTSITDLEREKTSLSEQIEKIQLSTSIGRMIPSLNNGMNSDEAMAVLTANGYSFKKEGDSYVAMKNGEILKDNKLQSPVKADEAIKSFFTEKKWVGEPAPAPKTGRGGGNVLGSSGGPIIMKMSEFKDRWLEENPGGSLQGEAFMQAAAEAKAQAEAAGQKWTYA